MNGKGKGAVPAGQEQVQLEDQDIKAVAQAICGKLREAQRRSENCGGDPDTCLNFLESLMNPPV